MGGVGCIGPPLLVILLALVVVAFIESPAGGVALLVFAAVALYVWRSASKRTNHRGRG
jgi:hypothetical protein